MREFTLEELEKCNGKDGAPVYIAHQNRVYDVSASKLWKTGTHMKRHPAGKDLTTDIQAAPHGTDVLERYPQIGVVKVPQAPQVELPAVLDRLLAKYPMLRRHPHPMTVHFPIVFMFSATIFNVLFLATGYRPFESTGFHCLGAGVLFSVVTILTGWYTWWLNYLARPMRAVAIKKRLSPVLLAVALAAFVWRLAAPGVMVSLEGAGYLYLMLILSLLPLVTIIGWFGAELTFPIERE